MGPMGPGQMGMMGPGGMQPGGPGMPPQGMPGHGMPPQPGAMQQGNRQPHPGQLRMPGKPDECNKSRGKFLNRMNVEIEITSQFLFCYKYKMTYDKAI